MNETKQARHWPRGTDLGFLLLGLDRGLLQSDRQLPVCRQTERSTPRRIEQDAQGTGLVHTRTLLLDFCFLASERLLVLSTISEPETACTMRSEAMSSRKEEMKTHRESQRALGHATKRAVLAHSRIAALRNQCAIKHSCQDRPGRTSAPLSFFRMDALLSA